MKKIVSLLIAVMMVSTVAFGAANISSATAEYKTITVNYSGVTSDEATVMVYRVGNDASMPDFEEENIDHKIVGLNQDTATGTFEIRLDSADYTGYLVAKVGGDGTVATYSIKVTGGVPESITTEVDCEGGTVTVPSGGTLTIGYLKLKDAYVNNSNGVATITYENKVGADLDLAGNIYFDESGNIHSAVDKTPVTLTIATGEATKAVGFIWDDSNVAEGSYGYTVTGPSGTVTKAFEIASGLSGNFRFAVGVENVPESEELTISFD